MIFSKKKNKYGYKVCYRIYGKHKIKIHFVTYTYDEAISYIQYCEDYKQNDRDTNELILNAKWFVRPIRTKKQYIELWRYPF